MTTPDFLPNAEGIGADAEHPAEPASLEEALRLLRPLGSLDTVTARAWSAVSAALAVRSPRPETAQDDERERWACWLTETADQADDITEGQRDGLRLAAEHLRSEFIVQQVARIRLAASRSPREESAAPDGTTPSGEVGGG